MPAKNIVIILGHPEAESFCAAIAETYLASASQAGHLVKLFRLGAIDFDPVLRHGYNQRQALEPGLQEIREAISAAAHLVFVYPIWWFGPPAILKGWIDRVFTRKFAFDFGPEGMRGLLTHERALIVNTLGGDEATYQRERWRELLARPIVEGVLGACGIGNVAYRAFYQVTTVAPAERRAMLDQVRE